ncbi:hypothetical protein AAT19DRAFT_15077 [Rhodotorula toruloides]|uniref:Uncharacterized protein n=1 Tax=Rhodotorula toruloides TaxID=5286 RepID=A0A2T0A9P0_RHOTO|nr:hypothetical protein AAT19DRAFT_15077 [Rhodotorula toruloides]
MRFSSGRNRSRFTTTRRSSCKTWRRVSSRPSSSSAESTPPPSAPGAERGRVWTVPLGEHCIWSIAQIELERYSFFVPPSLAGGQPRSLNPPPTLNPMYNSPRPSKPIDTDLPVVRYIEIPRERGGNRHFGGAGRTGREEDEGMILLHGSHLSPALSLTLSTHPLPPSSITYKSPTLALIQLPRGVRVKRGEKVGVVGRRGDGVCVRWEDGVR